MKTADRQRSLTVPSVLLLACALLFGACGESSPGAKDPGDRTSAADAQTSRTLYVKASGMVKKLGIT